MRTMFGLTVSLMRHEGSNSRVISCFIMDRRRRIQNDRVDECFKNNRLVTEPLLRRASKLQNRVSYGWLTVVEDRQVEITSVHS